MRNHIDVNGCDFKVELLNFTPDSPGSRFEPPDAGEVEWQLRWALTGELAEDWVYEAMDSMDFDHCDFIAIMIGEGRLENA